MRWYYPIFWLVFVACTGYVWGTFTALGKNDAMKSNGTPMRCRYFGHKYAYVNAGIMLVRTDKCIRCERRQPQSPPV